MASEDAHFGTGHSEPTQLDLELQFPLIYSPDSVLSPERKVEVLCDPVSNNEIGFDGVDDEDDLLSSSSSNYDNNNNHNNHNNSSSSNRTSPMTPPPGPQLPGNGLFAVFEGLRPNLFSLPPSSSHSRKGRKRKSTFNFSCNGYAANESCLQEIIIPKTGNEPKNQDRICLHCREYSRGKKYGVVDSSRALEIPHDVFERLLRIQAPRLKNVYGKSRFYADTTTGKNYMIAQLYLDSESVLAIFRLEDDAQDFLRAHPLDAEHISPIQAEWKMCLHCNGITHLSARCGTCMIQRKPKKRTQKDP